MPLIPLLLVEDEPDLREAVGEYLAACGFEVTAVGTGRAALEGNFPEPRILLTDLSLPDRRGDRLIREFHALHPACQLYVHSGDSSFVPGEELVDCGLTMDHVFYKPSDLGEMVERLKAGVNPKL